MAPSRMSNVAIRRRAGSFTTVSASSVVKPVPEKAESDWNRATSSDKPVIERVTVPMRITNIERATTRRRDTTETIGATSLGDDVYRRQNR